MKAQSIGTRFLRDVTLAIVGVMLVFGVAVVRLEQGRAEQRLEAKSSQVLEQLGIVLAKALWNMNRGQVDKIVLAYLVDEDIVSIKVFESDAVMSYHTRIGEEDVDLVAEPERAPSLAKTRTVSAEILYEEDPEPLGSVEVVLSEESIRRQVLNSSAMMATSVLLLVVIEALVVLLLVKRRITVPLLEIVRTAEQMADGDLGAELAETGTDSRKTDEIGLLAGAFRRMTAYLREMARVAERIAAGDLSHDVEPRSERDHLGRSFQRMTSSLRDVTLAATAIAEGDLERRLEPRGAEDSLGLAFEKMNDYLIEMAGTAERIARGDLGAEIRPRSDNDALGRAFREMSQYLQEIAGVATAIAGGDLRRSFRPRGSDDVLGSAFQKMEFLRRTMSQIVEGSEKLGDASTKLRSISERMAEDAEKASAQVGIVSRNSRKISGNAGEVASSIEDLSQSIAGISRNTEEVMTVVGEAVETAAVANRTISRLTKSSGEIGDIIQVITGIAKQTNMLALNAEIQAARAGAAGKGFVVVANRIKELADKTRDSTDDITRRIEAIQTSSEEAREAIDQVSIIVGHVEGISRSIAGSVQVQNVTTGEISANISEAAQESEEVTRAIVGVEEISRNAAEEAISVQQASRQLGDVADQLRQLVERFRI